MFANTFAGVLDFADRFEENLATILKKSNQMENHITMLAQRVEEIQIIQKRYHSKMMEGFHCIEKCFKLNCGAQMTMSEQIDEMTGTITDFDECLNL